MKTLPDTRSTRVILVITELRDTSALVLSMKLQLLFFRATSEQEYLDVTFECCVELWIDYLRSRRRRRRHFCERAKESRVNSVPEGMLSSKLSERTTSFLFPTLYTAKLSRALFLDSSLSRLRDAAFRNRHAGEEEEHEDCHLGDLVSPRATIPSRLDAGTLKRTNERASGKLWNFLSTCVRRLQSTPARCDRGYAGNKVLIDDDNLWARPNARARKEDRKAKDGWLVPRNFTCR